jgi:DNA adenine methylase
MLPVAECLAAASPEHRPAPGLIASYGRHRSMLLYVNPPYPGVARDRHYRHKMTSEGEHCELAAALRSCRAKAILSDYVSNLHASWHRRTLEPAPTRAATGPPNRSPLVQPFAAH